MIDQIRELYNQGRSGDAIAEELGMNRAHVYIHLRTIREETPWYKKICVVCGKKRRKGSKFCTKHYNRYERI